MSRVRIRNFPSGSGTSEEKKIGSGSGPDFRNEKKIFIYYFKLEFADFGLNFAQDENNLFRPL